VTASAISTDGTVSVLGIDVSPELLDSWTSWLAPDPQPFLVGADEWTDIESDDGTMTPELRDTYRMWGIAPGSRALWLSRDRFHEVAPAVRGALVREQMARRRGAVPSVRGWQDALGRDVLRREGDGHRFVWWRSLIETNTAGVLHRVISLRRLASRHGEVTEATWDRCADVLPFARALAGTFPDGSTTCCFGTVMGAAGADDRDACGSFDAFSSWLSSACRPGGDSMRPGTVLVWRNGDGDPLHAAVCIGDGWALEKPSQEWHSPRAIAFVRDVVNTSRIAGQRLERHTIAS
jgi:hypothetical protein